MICGLCVCSVTPPVRYVAAPTGDHTTVSEGVGLCLQHAAADAPAVNSPAPQTVLLAWGTQRQTAQVQWC
jgi:hypothetical protein